MMGTHRAFAHSTLPDGDAPESTRTPKSAPTDTKKPAASRKASASKPAASRTTRAAKPAQKQADKPEAVPPAVLETMTPLIEQQEADNAIKNVPTRLTHAANIVLQWAVLDAAERHQSLTMSHAANQAVVAYWGPRKVVSEGGTGEVLEAVELDQAPARRTSLDLTRQARNLLAWASYDAEINGRRLHREVALNQALVSFWGPRKAAGNSDGQQEE